METNYPKLDNRRIDQLLTEIIARAPFYVPGWRPEPGYPGLALARIVAYLLQRVNQGLNRLPEKSFLAFLETLGLKLLPAIPARAPVTFQLAQGVEDSVIIPAGTQVGAGEVIFETEQAFRVIPAKLAEAYLVDEDCIYRCPPPVLSGEPAVLVSTRLLRDAADKTRELVIGETKSFQPGDLLRLGNFSPYGYGSVAQITETSLLLNQAIKAKLSANSIVERVTSWEWFQGEDLQRHQLYLGHSTLFNFQKGVGEGCFLRLKVYLTATENWYKPIMQQITKLKWEYWGEDLRDGMEKWLELQFVAILFEDLETLIAVLRKENTGPSKVLEIEGTKTFWIRVTITDNALPPISSLGVSLENNNCPDGCFFNDIPLKIESSYFPFGESPKNYDSFYIGNRECFSKPGLGIQLNFTLGQKGIPRDQLTISWEYWDGQGWMSLPLLYLFDSEKGALKTLDFTCPLNLKPTVVNGHENYWIRARIVKGSFGNMDTMYDWNSKQWFHYGEIIPPRIDTLNIRLAPPKEPYHPEISLTYNNLEYQNVTTLNQPGESGGSFRLFVMDTPRTWVFYLGLDRKPEQGPILLFFEMAEDQPVPVKIPVLSWETYTDQGWTRLGVVDHTDSFLRSGVVEILFPETLRSIGKFGQDLYWLRVVDQDLILSQQASTYAPRINRILLNTGWVVQGESFQGLTLGSGAGSAGQEFSLGKAPVLSATLWVNEINSIMEEEREALKSRNDGGVQEIRDSQEQLQACWVRWQAVDDLMEAGAEDRRYEIDSISGTVKFGDGVHGKVPPMGNGNIKADFRQGGGRRGNVGAGQIKDLKSAISFVDKVSNPLPAGGGTDPEETAGLIERGPRLIRHRNRAVSGQDFEWLAYQASAQIARAKCLANFNRQSLKPGTGWVTVIVIPKSGADRPKLSRQLKEQVTRYLKDHTAQTLVAPDQFGVMEPVYLELSITATLKVTAMDKIPLLEGAILKNLQQFLHPLSGRTGQGWEFGKTPCPAEFYVRLEKLDGVDYVEDLQLTMTGLPGGPLTLTGAAPGDAARELPEYTMISNGKHRLLFKI